MTFDIYVLPTGERIPVDSTASKGAKTIGFTRADGVIVPALLVKAHR